ncbi:hypothetical protein HPP92_005689 [Vanilla planifolia]|uniref:Starch synthase catalytic domain-containing protein n=1 Tax=Vanilla planifolia TaxID=51239 RepID=A0A835VF45_VANPL|nr:hypothetical protein HPP92_005689 [Vanilla planifolia]
MVTLTFGGICSAGCRKEKISLVWKAEAARTVEKELSDVNFDSNQYTELMESKTTKTSSIRTYGNISNKTKEPFSLLPDQKSVMGNLGSLKHPNVEARKPTSAEPSQLLVNESKAEKSKDLEEPNVNELDIGNGILPEEDNKPSSALAGVNVMNVILVAAECAPWSKTGGLGDVAGALPKALANRGHRVMVVVPRYGDYSESKDTGVRKRYNVDGQNFEEVDEIETEKGLVTKKKEHYINLFKLQDPIGGEHFNIFAAGLRAADRIVTVSHGYAWELKTVEGGWGLHEIIKCNDWKFRGIVNGIDTKEWNPKLDVFLNSDGYSNYSIETVKIGKPKCKAALQQQLGLPVRAEVPIIAFIGRLDPQKGVDLIAEAMHWIVDQDVQLILLGSGRPELEAMLRSFDLQYHDKVRSWVGFSVKMAHRITAGADILLMPSRFEPCGLNQLYAMVYGTVPVAHAVGGLRDTVVQFDPYNETGFGWTFDRADTCKLIDALGNCLNTYWNYKASWEGLQRRGMMQDLGWDNAARRYDEVLVAAKYQCFGVETDQQIGECNNEDE